MGKGRARHVCIEAGSEYSPTGSRRIALTLEADGRIEMTRRRVGMAAPERWSGRVPRHAITMIDEALERAGFPGVSDRGGALLPDEAPTTFTVRRGWWREQSASVASKASRIPGYREAIEIFEALCSAASGGALGHVKKELRWLVGDDPDDEEDGPQDDAAARTPGQPRVGEEIYLPSERYLSRGEDDFAGGRCTVIAVHLGTSAGGPCAFVEVAEQRGVRHNWEVLAPIQDTLRARFGDRRGHSDPDDRPEYNESITDQLMAEGEYWQIPVTWRETSSPEFPLETEWGGKQWRLRLNDFPAKPLYTLFVDGSEIASYDVLPKAWRAPERLRR